MIKLTTPDRNNSRNANENFGYVLAISGDYAIVGARGEATDETGSNLLTDAGAACIFKKNSITGKWEKKQKLSASDRKENDWFEFSVSINGNYAVVGALYEDENATGCSTLTNAGSSYVFLRSSANWAQQQKLAATDRGVNDWFGYSLSINGTNLVIGAYQEDEDAGNGNTFSNPGSAYDGNYAVAGAYLKANGVSSTGVAFVYVFKLGPNPYPAKNELRNSRRLQSNDRLNATLLDATGRIMQQYDVLNNGQSLNVQMQPAGSYILRLQTQTTKRTFLYKVVKTN